MSKYTPIHGDRVSESGPSGISGHIQAIRFSLSGTEAQVWEDGALQGHWIAGSNLTMISRHPAPTECEFLGWT